jgi:hypothetical protein
LQGAHNDGSERDARSPVWGRENHDGSRSSRGTEVASIFYTLRESARKNGLDPRIYLRLAALRSWRGEPVVLPHEVTPELAAAYGPQSPPGRRIAGLTRCGAHTALPAESGCGTRVPDDRPDVRTGDGEDVPMADVALRRFAHARGL